MITRHHWREYFSRSPHTNQTKRTLVWNSSIHHFRSPLFFFYQLLWGFPMTHWKRPWCWERLRARGEGGNRGWDGWMASPIQWTWTWAKFRRWWDRETWRAAVHGTAESDTDWVTGQQWLSGRESSCSSGDIGSIPGWGKSPGGRNGNPLQYSCLGNPMGSFILRALVNEDAGFLLERLILDLYLDSVKFTTEK